jgi:phage terminase small subunit
VQARKKRIDKTAKGAREETEKRPPRAERLSLQERAFVRAYASDPQSPTFGVGVRSAMVAGYSDIDAPLGSSDYNSANKAAQQLLARPKVKSEIDRIFDATKLTLADRARVVSDILHDDTITTIHTTESIDPEGISRVTSRQTILSSNAANRIRVLDIANRMDGLYSKTGEAVKLHARTLQPLLDHYSKQLRRSLADSALQERIAGQGEVIEGEVVVESTLGGLDSVVPISPSEQVVSEPSEVGEQLSRQAGDEW